MGRALVRAGRGPGWREFIGIIFSSSSSSWFWFWFWFWVPRVRWPLVVEGCDGVWNPRWRNRDPKWSDTKEAHPSVEPSSQRESDNIKVHRGKKMLILFFAIPISSPSRPALSPTPFTFSWTVSWE